MINIMKRVGQIILFLFFLYVPLKAQTDTALRMYKEAKSHKSGVRDYLRQDFSAVDSTSMHDLAVLLYRDKDFASAGVCWEIALPKVKKHGKAYEQILNALSSAYMELGDYDKIQWLLLLIEEHNQQELLKECNDYKCKLERAQYYILQGDESKAKAYMAESLDLCITEEQRIEVEEAYAKVLFDVQDFEGCAQYYLSAARRRKVSGSGIEQMGTDLYWAAQNYMLANRFDLAEECAREGVRCFEGARTEKDKKLYLKHLAALGDAMYCQQKNSDALTVYQKELEGYSSMMPGSEAYADALEDVAKVEVRLQRYEDAKGHYQEALDVYKSLAVDDKYSNTYSMLLVCLRKAGDTVGADMMENEADRHRNAVYKRVLDSELESIELTRKYLSSSVYVNSLNTIAGSYFGLDQYEKAAEYFALYSENLRGMLRERFLLMTSNDRQRVWQEQKRHIDDFCYNLSVLPEHATPLMQLFVPTFYDFELLSKGIMLNSSIEFEKVLNMKQDAGLMDIYRQIRSNYEEIDRLQTNADDNNLQKVLALKQSNIPLERKLMQDCSEIADYTDYLSYSWKDVQKNLGEKDVAIEFASVQMTPLDQHIYILALILHSTGEPVMKVICTKAMLKELANKPDLYENPEYYKYFWGFMQEHIDGMDRVFFAPGNLLSNIAVEYLKDGEKTFFESREVYRLSSTKELCRKHNVFSHRRLCVFGDIDYSSVATSEMKGGLSFGRLKHSRMEIDQIINSMAGQYEVDMYDGSKATELNFMGLSELSPSIVHISSHGKYFGDTGTSEDAAMEKSILALTGANIPGQPKGNDGLVTASDVAGMNLRQCDLAVLSACETGLGGLGADGVFGLQRGFKNAGVHTLLMSLKPVYDESTALLMIEFYRGLAAGLSKREALVNAQKVLRSDNRFGKGEFWAPFILLDALDTDIK